MVLATPIVLPFLENVFQLKLQFWPYPIDSQRKWFVDHVGAQDLHVLAFDDADPLVGDMRIALGDIEGAGVIETMCVSKDAQRKGVGVLVMQAANAAIPREGLTGLLSCEVGLVPFYAGCGSQPITLLMLRAGQTAMQLTAPEA